LVLCIVIVDEENVEGENGKVTSSGEIEGAYMHSKGGFSTENRKKRAHTAAFWMYVKYGSTDTIPLSENFEIKVSRYLSIADVNHAHI
jgi:hypothetical protein